MNSSNVLKSAATNGDVNKLPRRGVYAVTPEDLSGESLVRAVREALRGGCVLIQYRAKPPKWEDAQSLHALCMEFQVPLILNDDVNMAQRLGVGVHLGESDQGVAEARRLLGSDAIIGASCYDSLALAHIAAGAGASYVAFGSFFTSKTKTQPRRADVALLQSAASLGVPRTAIGGIDASNAAALVASGVEFIAVVNGIFGQADVCAASAALSSLFENPTP